MLANFSTFALRVKYLQFVGVWSTSMRCIGCFDKSNFIPLIKNISNSAYSIVGIGHQLLVNQAIG